MTLEQARVQVIRRLDLLAIRKEGLIRHLIDLKVPHKVSWEAYTREELIEKLKNYVWQKRLDLDE